MEDSHPVLVVNFHTILGGVIGIIAMFLPWVIRNESEDYSLIEILSGNVDLGFSLGFLLPLIGIIFILGTASVFLSPYGAAAQIGGASMILFLVGIASSVNTDSSSVAIGLGPYLGLISSAVVFVSIIFPFGVGYGHWRPLGNRGRNNTFSYYRDLSDSDGLPVWWWAVGPGWFWYWWFEMRAGWAFRDLYRERMESRADKIVRKEAAREFGHNDSESFRPHQPHH